MSILACLIGILTLLISVSMQVKQMQTDDISEDDKALAMQNRDLKKQAVVIQTQIDKTNERVSKENSTVDQLAKLKDRKIILHKKLEEVDLAKDPTKTDAALQKTIENLKAEIAALQKARPALEQKLKELKEELAKRKNPPKLVESVIVKPGGTGIRGATNLFFVEANSTGIVIISDDGKKVPVSTDAIPNNADYANFLKTAKATRDSMVLFLIRRDGAKSYSWAAGVAEATYEVKTGKLPIPNNGPIDLSLFKKK